MENAHHQNQPVIYSAMEYIIPGLYSTHKLSIARHSVVDDGALRRELVAQGPCQGTI